MNQSLLDKLKNLNKEEEDQEFEALKGQVDSIQNQVEDLSNALKSRKIEHLHTTVETLKEIATELVKSHEETKGVLGDLTASMAEVNRKLELIDRTGTVGGKETGSTYFGTVQGDAVAGKQNKDAS